MHRLFATNLEFKHTFNRILFFHLSAFSSFFDLKRISKIHPAYYNFKKASDLIARKNLFRTYFSQTSINLYFKTSNTLIPPPNSPLIRFLHSFSQNLTHFKFHPKTHLIQLLFIKNLEFERTFNRILFHSLSVLFLTLNAFFKFTLLILSQFTCDIIFNLNTSPHGLPSPRPHPLHISQQQLKIITLTSYSLPADPFNA